MTPTGYTVPDLWEGSVSQRIAGITTQEAMMDGEEGTTKFAEGAKREARLQVMYSGR